MSNQSVQTDQWLSLSAAAKHLGIHTSTLRRWADSGSIAVTTTPGGHRRFKRSDLTKFLATDKIRRRKQGVEKTWAENALVETRHGITQQPDQSWLHEMDSSTRERYRLMGQQLMGLTLQFISQPEEDESLLARARELGHAYGVDACKISMPLTDALQAAMFFRDRLIETAMQLPSNTHIQPEANLRLLRRINTLLNNVHLAIAEVYDAQQSNQLPGN